MPSNVRFIQKYGPKLSMHRFHKNPLWQQSKNHKFDGIEEDYFYVKIRKICAKLHNY